MFSPLEIHVKQVSTISETYASCFTVFTSCIQILPDAMDVVSDEPDDETGQAGRKCSLKTSEPILNNSGRSHENHRWITGSVF